MDLDLFNKLAQTLFNLEASNPVPTPIPADDLYDQLDLSLSDDPASDLDYENALLELVEAAPKTSSKLFFNQLFGGRKPESVLGDLLAVLLNNSMYTYKVAGAMVGVEKIIINKIINIVGYPATADGTFASGGSMTNLMAMIMARDKKIEQVRHVGVRENMIVYTSAESHYSIEKNAAFIGVGRDQVRKIDTDDQGRMLVNVLSDKIAEDILQGNTPFFVNATAGTTVLGAFDPIADLAVVCDTHNLWLHVDGAYCGGVIFSAKHAHLIDGVAEADSFSFNAHKMLNTSLTCSLIVTKERSDLLKSFSNDADYLYQTDDDEFNLGKTSLQCGRRNDALKVWTLWKSIGTRGIKQMVDNQFLLADVARAYISNHVDYTLYSFENSISICFNYKNTDPIKLCRDLYENGTLMVGHGSFRGQNFIRLITINSTYSEADILQFFNVLEQFVADHEDQPAI